MACVFRTRDRERSEYTFEGTYHFVYPNGTSTKPIFRNLNLGFSQHIVDIANQGVNPVTKVKNSCPLSAQKLVFKPVSNVKSLTSYPYGRFIANVSNKNGTPYGVAHGDATFWWAVVGSPRSLLGEPLETIGFTRQELWRAILRIEPTLDRKLPQMNLWETIFELNDLKKSLGFFGLAVKGLAESLAEKHIAYSFGIAPIKGEIMAVWKVLSMLDEKIDKWNQMAEKGQLLDFHETIKSYSDMQLGVPHSRLGGAISGHEQLNWTSTHLISGVAKLHIYGRPVRIPDSKRFHVMIRTLGLDKPITGAWEAVPFSWFIDYFVNIGEMINNWESGIENMFKLDIVSAGYSNKSNHDITINMQGTRYYPGAAFTGELYPGGFATEVGSSYHRRALPTNNMFEIARAELSNEMKLQMNMGWKQFSYVAAIAYLTGRR